MLSRWILWLSLVASVIGRPLSAEEARLQPLASAAPHYLASIQLHSVEEMEALFSRAEALVSEDAAYGQRPAVAMVLHGPEIRFFARENLAMYRMLVARAAQLDAFGVVDIKVCETYLRQLQLPAEQMPPFVELVPYGPAEEDRLERAGYVDF